MAIIIGTSGNDTGLRSLIGSGGADVIFGNGGNDIIAAGGGNDTIHVIGGNSTVSGGEGHDSVMASNVSRGSFDGGTGTDTFTVLNPSAGGTYRLDGGASTMGSGPGFSLANFENLTAGDRNDTIYGSEHANVLDAGDGHDVVWAGRGHDRLIGGAGNDQLYGQSGEDLLDGGLGDDWLHGGTEYDTATYAGRTEAITVSAHGKVGVGLHETDTLVAVEKVIGGAGNDQLSAGVAQDFDGGAGHDSYYADDRASVFNGGEGVDYVVYAASATGVGVDLQQGSGWMGDAMGDRLVSVENVSGSWHGDTLRGSEAANFIAGLGGDDVILGRGGDDTLYGGDGRDTLTGGAGRDAFTFYTGDDGAQDRITDFQRGTDRIALEGDGNIHISGWQEFTRLTHYSDPTNAAGFTAGTINVRHSGGNTYVDVNNSDNTVNGMDRAEIAIRIDGIHDLRLSDFDF